MKAASVIDILTMVDNRIEINRRKNRVIESTASSLFKSWFIDYDCIWAKINGWEMGLPPGQLGLPTEIEHLFPDGFMESEYGMIPRGWQVKPINQLAEIYLFFPGKTLQYAQPSPYSLPMSDVIVDVRPGQIALRPRPGISKLFLWLWAEWSRDEIINLARDTEFSEINIENFGCAPVCIPPSKTMDAFHQLVRPLYSRMLKNNNETLLLQEIRNDLLTRVIAGELHDSNVAGFAQEIEMVLD